MESNLIHYAPEALKDMDALWDYIAFELLNPDAADHTVDQIQDKVDRLKHSARIGTPLRSVTGIESEYRFLISGNYMIFYRVLGQDVYVDRIIYGKRDYMRILFPKQFPNERSE